MAIVAAWAGGCAPEPPRSYSVRNLPHLHADKNVGTDQAWVQGDFNADGIPELAMETPTGLIGIAWDDDGPAVTFQYNFPTDMIGEPGAPRLGAALDVSGTGHDQVVYTLAGPGKYDWRLQIYDPTEGVLLMDHPLPKGPDTRPDGLFKASWSVAGTLPGLAPSGGPLLLLAEVVGHDLYGRGLVALDGRTAETVWRFDMGPNPIARTLRTGHLDGDERLDILIAANSPDNLGGVEINGTSDDRAWVFALTSEGRLLWRRPVGGVFYTPGLEVADLDGDWRPEVIVTTENHNVEPGTNDLLRVLDGRSGRVLAECDLPGGCSRPLLLEHPGSPVPEILAGNSAGRLRSYVYDEGALTLTRATEDTVSLDVSHVLDVLPQPGLEIVALRDPRTESARLQVLDREFRVRAQYPLGRTDTKLTSHLWSPRPDLALLVVACASGRYGLAFDAVEAPGSSATDRTWGVVLGTSLVGTLALGGLGYQRRRTRRRPDRDLLRRLHRALEESSHGTLAATRGVERLTWLVEARLGDTSPDSLLRDRLRDGLDDFRDAVAPELESILDMADRAELDRDDIDKVRNGLAGFMERIDALDLERPDLGGGAAASDTLKAAAADTVAGFRRLQRETTEHFAARPVSVARRLMSQRDEPGVEMRIETEAPEDDLLACIDTSDLRFVLENLIDNALRAMEDVERRDLSLRFERVRDRVELTVTDSGPGVDPALADRIFEPGASTREHGGLGLARSREVLSPWRGRLDLENAGESGARFRLSLKALRPAGRDGH